MSGDSAPQQLAQKWLSSFIESEKMSGDSGEFIEHLKADLYPDEVYVFTPKGDIKRLPRDATAIDFAYAVHSDLGNRTVGARINQKAVPLFEKLRNGDKVEIITSPRSRPEPGWLNFAVTSKARSAIRHFLTQRKGKDSLRLGQKLLRKALWDQGYRRYRIPSAHKLKLLNALELPDWSELLSEIGLGKRLAPLVAKQLISKVEESARAPKKKRPAKDRNNPGNITIQGTEGLLVNYAKCCHPIPDDRIIGTTTADRGLVVHRLRCPNSRAVMKHPDRFFHLNWSGDTQGVFEAMIKLEARNEPGVLSDITNSIASHESNINKVTVEGDAGNLSRMSFVIEVRNRKHLADVLRDLHVLPPVIRVHRAR